MGIMGKLTATLHTRRGQATTELAIFGFVMLIALASLLRHGQIMNQQQNMRMHAFRKALDKAYSGYDSSLGGASYSSLKHMHMVSLYRDYYDGSQRAVVSGGATVLWDSDLMYADSGDKPNSYVEVDGIEKNLGPDARREEIVTDSNILMDNIRESYKINDIGLENDLYAEAYEHLTTRVKLDDGSEILFEQDNTFTTDETWNTPW